MKKQIIIVGGGTTFDTYKEYIFYLKNRKVSIENFKTKKDWKSVIGKFLGNKFEVFILQMPNRNNARYREWKIWFKRMLPFIKNNAIFIGHSLGGIFLAKYLSENSMLKKIKATILVAAPFDNEGSDESLTDFKLSPSFKNKKFAKQGGNIYLFYSKDDSVVSFKQADKYKKFLPKAKVLIFKNKKHFNQKSFPEIVKLIKSIK